MSTENRIGLGAKLESGRKARGWSQQEAAKRTKLRSDTIQKLENEEFDELPSLAYARGFIRIYARELGLDGTSLLKELDGAAEDDFDINDLRPEDLESIPHRVQPPELTPQNIGLVVIALIIIAVIVVAVMGLFRFGPEKSAELARNISDMVQPLEKATQKDFENAQKNEGGEEVRKAEPAEGTVRKAEPAEGTVRKAEPVNPGDAAVAPAVPVAVPGEVAVAPAVPVVPGATYPNKLQFYATAGISEGNRWVEILGKRGTEDVTLFKGTIPEGQVFPSDKDPQWNADVFIILMKETQGINIILNGQNWGTYPDRGSQRFLMPR